MSIAKVRIQPGDGDRRHGTPSGYTNHRCRCSECVAAWVGYHARWRAESKLSYPDDNRHGSASTYGNYGCRCQRCTDAKVAYNRELRARRRAT
jgi:hypothetical protein